ncbi:MAG: tetratricopeptide repeat protein [Proteobacteria bacterium]|nr:tetratricopeptide repeat protein [Pseudomonadota bacterium]
MSLLLDALKKAEKAKDEAKRRAQGTGPAPDEDETLLHVRTRNELPDISRPMEIHSEDIPGGLQIVGADTPASDALRSEQTGPQAVDASAAADVRNEMRVEPEIVRRPASARAPEPAADPQASQRAAAKNVFEAKFREPNPKLPFYITMAVLSLFAVGTVVYFWYQLRPPPALVNTDPKPPADEKKIDVVDTRPAAGNQPAPQSPVQPPAIPGLPAQAAVTPATAPTPAAAAPAQAAPQAPIAAPKAAAPQGSAATPPPRGPRSNARAGTGSQPGRPADDPSKLSINRAAPEVNPKVEAAWRAYNQGDLQTAHSNYLEALREEPSNRDALLGMAALEVRANRPELAAPYYQKLLEANPRDPYAQAGLLALRGQVADPVQTESRVKTLLANDPESSVLYFTLGNQYAQQGRWPEAQQAYFKAFSADPENPDFAYNLAVSLDQVRQPKLALEYYRRAIALAQQRASSFDQALARNRVQELAR